MAFDSTLRMTIDTRTGERSLRRLRGELEDTESRGRRTFSSLSRVAVGFSGVIAGLGLTKAFSSAIKSTADYEAQMKSLDAVIRATGQSAGFTSEALRGQAEQLALATLQNTQGVLEAQRVLLSFRSISGQTFEDALALSADLSTVFGTSLSQSATQLGKALEDPIQGITALRRSGVSFTESQKDVIRQMVETNRVGEAQRLILGEIQKQVGGAAEGEASGLSGAFDTLSQRTEEFGLAMGQVINENGAFTDFINRIAEGVERVNQRLDPDRSSRAFDLLQEEIDLRSQLQRLQEFDPNALGVEALQERINNIYEERISLLDKEAGAQQRSADAVTASIEAEQRRAEQRAKEQREKEIERQRELREETERARSAAVGGITEQLQSELLALSLTERELLSHEMAVAGATTSERELALATFDASQKLRDQARAAEEAAEAQQDYERRLSTLKGRLDPVAEDFERFANSAALLRLALEKGDISPEAFERYMQELVQSFSNAGDEGGEEAGKNFSRGFESQVDRVADSLQNSITSGDWAGIGATIGASLASGVAQVVGDQVSGSLGTGIASAIGGPIVGAIAGGVVGLAAQKIADFFSDDWDPTEMRQAAQGTGTVLADMNAKSESIRRAVEGSESGIGQLVGINQNMLRALQTLQLGISGAVGMVARQRSGMEFSTSNQFSQAQLAAGVGFGGVTAGSFGPAFGLGAGAFDLVDDALGGILSDGVEFLDNLTGGLLSSIGSSVFGGDQKVVDEGIRIIGGRLSDLVNQTLVQAYATIKEDGGWFRSDKRFDRFQNIATNQFSLAFESIYDAVEASAGALGINASRRLNNLNIDTQRISLEDLSPEEQKAELEAVFSTIFDRAAGAAVPFIDEFQRAGEGLGETLARVANQTLVTEEAVTRLGIQFSDLSGRQLVVASERLMEAAGGVEQFISSMEGFIDNFASDAQQFALAQSDITRALSQSNLQLPATRDGYYDLLQAQNGATAAGADNIATLLRLQGVADEYYTFLEDANRSAIESQRDLLSVQQSTYRDALQEAEAMAGSVSRALDGLSLTGQQFDAASRERALASLDRMATTGQIGSQPVLDDALASATNINAGEFGTLNDYIRTVARTGATLTNLQQVTDRQVTREQKLLANIERRLEAMTEQLSAVGQAGREGNKNTATTARILTQFNLDGIEVRS
jgi:hypothetical protein